MSDVKTLKIAIEMMRSDKAEQEAAFMYFMNMVSNVLTDSQLDQQTKCGETIRTAYGRYWNMYFRERFEEKKQKSEKMSDKNLTLTITEQYETDALCNIFGEEDMFCLRYDYEAEPEIEYELEVVVRRVRKKENE